MSIFRPAEVGMLTSVSKVNDPILPRIRSEIRGCETPPAEFLFEHGLEQPEHLAIDVVDGGGEEQQPAYAPAQPRCGLACEEVCHSHEVAAYYYNSRAPRHRRTRSWRYMPVACGRHRAATETERFPKFVSPPL